MSGLLSTLNIAATGLSAQQLGVQTTASNIANAQTPGYARRTLDLEALSGGGSTMGGVRALGTTRVDDTFLRQTASRSSTELAGSFTRADWLSRLEAVRAPVEGSSVANAIDAFSDAFSSLAAHPEDSATREATFSAANSVSMAFQSTNADLANLRTQIDQAAGSSVGRATSMAKELASLNARIAGNPDSTDSALLDKRDVVASQLASSIGGTVIRGAKGAVSVHALGTMVVDGIHSLALTTKPNVSTGTLDIVATGYDGQTSILTNRVSGGELGGLMGVRNGDLVQQQKDLDQLAFDFGTAVNATHAAGYGLDANTGRDLYTLTPTAAGAANSISIAAGMDGSKLAASQTSTTLPGDNRNALAIADLRLGSTTNFAEQERASLASLTSSSGSAQADAENATSRNDVAQAKLTQVTGVSLDEEFIALQQYQRGYQASAKVLSVVNEMLDTLVKL